MDINLIPDIYVPSVDTSGNYIDSKPIIKNGIKCPCSNRTKVFDILSKFTTHMKTKRHQKWIEELNNNKLNYYTECLKNNETIENQKRIIAKMDIELKNKSLTIDYLTNELVSKNTTSITNTEKPLLDLLDI